MFLNERVAVVKSKSRSTRIRCNEKNKMAVMQAEWRDAVRGGVGDERVINEVGLRQRTKGRSSRMEIEWDENARGRCSRMWTSVACRDGEEI